MTVKSSKRLPKPQARNTRQKLCIQKIFSAAEGPLGVPEIFALAGKDVEKIGLATVYRIIGQLLEAGDIKKIRIPNAEDDVRYELSDKNHHHHHFFCTKCRKTFDLAKCPMTCDLNQFVLPGFEVETHELTLYGVCACCGKAKSIGNNRK